MIADTNFILRALDLDDKDQGSRARIKVKEFRQRGEQITVTTATAMELAHVLKSSAAGYGYSADEIRSVLQLVLVEPAFHLDESAILAKAIELLPMQVGIHDCYLAALAEHLGHQVLSFDKDLERLGVAATV